MGKRFLFDTLSKPLIDEKEINNRLVAIEEIINNKYYDQFDIFLQDIYDIERLNRRIDMENIHPFELYQLYLSFYQINKMNNFIKENNIKLFNINNKMNNMITIFLVHINNMFNLSILNDTNFSNYFETDKTFYNKNIHKEIDNLVEKIETGSNFIELLKNELEKLIMDDKSLFSKSDNSLITSKFNERDGHYLMLTNRRCKLLKEQLKNKEKIKIGNYILSIKDLEFQELPKSSNTKINCEKIKEISGQLIINKQSLASINKNKFREDCKEIHTKFNEFLLYWSYHISYIDFINSGAKCAVMNKYTKPIIEDHQNSFFNAVDMRHPIIENINKEFKYIPHSIALGGNNDLDGILLYGINSSGKSTLMKSIGLNIILAQIGYFVAAKKFVFQPYKTLFTRIIGNDNIYKGLSSFMVEMLELTAILKRNNNHTLVIGDEICRGTEEKSANIIVSYMLKTLSEAKSSFITATHLHKIVTLPTVQKLERVKAKHLSLWH